MKMTPGQLRLMIALPMLLMLGGTSSLASSLEVQPSTPQFKPFSDLETQDSTLILPEKPFSPEVFYDRTPCKLYGKC
ncbi:hypothetical protein [Lyngbya sp. PCC 8106]|uniref:hypothetical protein n=1 Tax=Lyngbya sp. (strain PCC 8106) TaxID=313612 RepID=UPI0000EAC157|nr:hypothetical protein [Lyngbya sp. PCC 8106]EAW35532.1 hypothetical protein L8106_13015 [Lyngbya sp. PCC 8106]